MGWIGHGSATTASPNKPCYVENALEFVDEPGEWYLDRETGVLTYMAAPDEDPNSREFVAPVAEQLILVRGTADAPVRNLRFERLALAHTAWPLPAFDYMGIQAGHHGTTMKEPWHVLALALEFRYAHGCAVERCRMTAMGASAIGFGAGCQNNAVRGCALQDIGGNGIMVGWRGPGSNLEPGVDLAADWADRTDAPVNNAVESNLVRECGAVNHGCVGIFDAFAAGTRIAHNVVTAMPYTGVSIGYRWNMTETSQRDCICEYNHIYDTMKMLADGGCIYTLGYQPGTVLRGNVLHDAHRSKYAHGGAPNNGIFFDQGTKALHVEGNAIYNTSGKPVRFNQTNAGELTWKNNTFSVGPDYSVNP
ncbi:MAG: hypothetical protein GY851_26315 [bacterium]|nr:hypothetical protein [bacterium]